ncbi:MAG: hypothetical protein ACUVQS_01520 [Candidatus Bipolaricaulaceae bacterium]
MKLLLVWAVVLTTVVGVLGAPTITARVKEVKDAVTLTVQIEALPLPAPAGLATGAQVDVRYIGVQPASGSESAAKALHTILVEGREVFLELDQVLRDESGRLLAYVYLDKDGLLMVNAMLVSTELFSHAPLSGASRYDQVFSYLDRTPWSKPSLACPVVYSWDEARRHLSETACVEGVVAGVGTSRGGDVFLNLGKPYPDPGRFTLFIPARHVGKFEAAFGPRFWTNLVGRTVQVLGTIKEYSGVPEIELSDPKNLTIF